MGRTGELEAVGAFFMLLFYFASVFIAIFILYISSTKARKILDHYLIKGTAWGEDENE